MKRRNSKTKKKQPKISSQINVYFLLNPHVMTRNHVRPFIINTSTPQASNTKSGPFTDIKSILQTEVTEQGSERECLAH